MLLTTKTSVYLHTALILIHLIAAAGWFGAYLSARALCCGGLTLERTRLARFLTLRVEMPLAAVAPLFGIHLSILRPEVWSQGWFHAKLTAFLLIYVLLILDARRLRKWTAAFEAGETPSRGGFMLSTALGLLAFIAVFFCAKVKFGI